MNVAIRNRKLKALLDVRVGPGAATLPVNVQRINLEFGPRIEGGNYGPRKFWRQCLPRLKYHNPAISMTVNRSSGLKGPANLSIFFSQPLKDDRLTSPSPPHMSTKATTNSSLQDSLTGVESFDMKDLDETGILNKLLHLTKGRPYKASSEEEAEMREVKEFEAKSQVDRERNDESKRKRATEKALLDQAKASE